MKIEVAIQCHNFQRRLCWMLSSIIDQVPRRNKAGLPKIAVSVAHVANSGAPTTEAVIECFQELGLDVRSCPYPGVSEFQYRGLTRNRQLEETDADWILFADSDMVYPLNFFGQMGFLLRTDFRHNPHCLYSQRYSTKLEETEAIVDHALYPYRVEDAYERIMALPGKKMSNIGAGYMHLADVQNLRDNFGGKYVDPNKCNDYSWETKYQKARSDQQFKKMLGKEKIPLPVQGHIQHQRDNNEGGKAHMELQR